MAPTKIGILGCGVISGIYIETAQKHAAIECAAVADVNPAAARHRADQYGIARALTPEELLADPAVEVVVNLTPNRLHGAVGLRILEAGKHLYSEKPLAVYREESQRLLAAASSAGLRVGNAPDTFMGGAWQTARKAIDDGLIGRPFAACAAFHGRRSSAISEGPRRETAPTRSTAPGTTSFFATEAFKYGVTVAFDMGPYYLHALINLLGPAARVSGATKKVFDEALRFGSRLPVEAPTHVTGLIELANGAVCQLLVSSDVYGTGLPHLEVYGTEGSLRCPDPNAFPGPVYLRRPGSAELVELECRHGYNQDSRGIGVADMAVAVRNGRPHRASGEMGAHVVDILNALHESADQGRRIELSTTCPRPAPLPTGVPDWEIAEPS
ncbi:MAG TPA: Gfo/Idh/MocA family oxidoreductase [Chloroflexota bacterium]|jgi:predicted dehydrogenase|nr:Gfo/Idh/MocA family oxidoreductase [Chloroflexota bacterium]